MKFSVFLFALICRVAAAAQAQHAPLTLNRYTVDGVSTIQVASAPAGAALEFYSEPWGGRLLAAGAADGDGGYKLSNLSPDTIPAFVLMIPAEGAEEPSAGTVAIMGEPLFELNNFSYANAEGGSQLLTWQGYCAPGAHFELWKSPDAENFTLVRIPTSADGSFYAVQDSGDIAVYELRVIENESIQYRQRINLPATAQLLRTAFAAAYSGMAGGLALYPTHAVTVISISVPDFHETQPYAIVDMNGKIALQGLITAPQQTVDVSVLRQGAYLFCLGSGRRPQRIKFARL